MRGFRADRKATISGRSKSHVLKLSCMLLVLDTDGSETTMLYQDRSAELSPGARDGAHRLVFVLSLTPTYREHFISRTLQQTLTPA